MQKVTTEDSNPTKTHKFEFDLKSISVDDLKKLYRHFQIEEFEDADLANDHSSFFRCFIHEETDGNKDAALLIRLAVMFSSNSARVLDTLYTNTLGKEIESCDLFINKLHEIEFDEMEYYDFKPGEFNIMFVIYDYDIEKAAEMLTKYNFLTPLN